MVYADAQDLGVQSRKTGCISLVGRDLACSDGRPGHGEEDQDHILAPIIAQRYIPVKVRRQGEVRG